MNNNVFINGTLTNERENGSIQKMIIASPKIEKGEKFKVAVLIRDELIPGDPAVFQLSKDQAIFAQKLLQELVENFDKVEANENNN